MAKAKSYKELSDELKSVMDDLESGDLDIDEAVACYERGLEIVKLLEAYLAQAENKVVQLKASIADDEEE